MNEDNRLLSVNNLTVEYHSDGMAVHAVRDVSFTLDRGKTLGLVGETGAGKTSVARAILRILPDHATRKAEGVVEFEGQDLFALPEREMQNYRGSHISMIFQDPMTALNPVKTVVSQVAEGLQRHRGLSKADAKKAAVDILESVGIPKNRTEEYPHQFSGGMKQRVVIAMALATDPALLIADEPTTALDVTIQAQVLDMMKRLRKQKGTSVIMITHDLGVIADTCDRVAVMYAGQIIEIGSLEDIFDHTAHPYTVGLFNSLPEMNEGLPRLKPIVGLPPDPTHLPDGCSFAPRCPYAGEECQKGRISLREIAPGHLLRCIREKGKENE